MFILILSLLEVYITYIYLPATYYSTTLHANYLCLQQIGILASSKQSNKYHFTQYFLKHLEINVNP